MLISKSCKPDIDLEAVKAKFDEHDLLCNGKVRIEQEHGITSISLRTSDHVAGILFPLMFVEGRPLQEMGFGYAFDERPTAEVAEVLPEKDNN